MSQTDLKVGGYWTHSAPKGIRRFVASSQKNYQWQRLIHRYEASEIREGDMVLIRSTVEVLMDQGCLCW
jgi:hypothetical protein